MGSINSNHSWAAKRIHLLKKPDKKIVERRNLLAQLFVVLLLGVAYQEMISPIKSVIRVEGFSTEAVVFFGVFFLTSLRFFIGAQLHLVNESLLKMRSGVWFFDFMIIIFEMVIFIFLGGVASFDAGRLAGIDFFELLMTVYIVDIFWVILQVALGKIFSSWKRSFIPLKWALINLGALLSTALLYCSSAVYSGAGMIIFGAVNAIAFIIDIFFIDYFKII